MKRRLPSLNGLRAFEAAARHQSFTRAAEELNVTQTAISHQIKRLEEQLGLRLFIRRNRRLLLTEEAQAYLPALRAAFDQLNEATERLLRRDSQGRLTVSTLNSFATKWLVPRLAGFQEAHPELDLRITTSDALIDFSRDDVDVAIRYGLGTWPGLTAEQLVSEDVFPVCSPKLLGGARPLERPEDLARHTLLHHTSWRDDWQMWLTAVGIDTVDASKGLEFDAELTMYQAAMDGLGVALGDAPLVEPDLAAGRLVKPMDIKLPRQAAYYIVAPRETWDHPKIQAFREWLLATVSRKAGAEAPRPA